MISIGLKLSYAFSWLLSLFVFCIHLCPPARAEEQLSFFAERYTVEQTLGDGRNGRVNFSWKQSIGPRPISKVVLKLRKQDKTGNARILVSFEDQSPIGAGEPRAVTSQQSSTMEWEANQELPQGRRLMVAAIGGHIYLESVAIDTISDWSQHKKNEDEESVDEMLRRVMKENASEEQKTNPPQDPLFGNPKPSSTW